jgi:hypothetical protein
MTNTDALCDYSWQRLGGTAGLSTFGRAIGFQQPNLRLFGNVFGLRPELFCTR